LEENGGEMEVDEDEDEVGQFGDGDEMNVNPSTNTNKSDSKSHQLSDEELKLKPFLRLCCHSNDEIDRESMWRKTFLRHRITVPYKFPLGAVTSMV